MAFSNLQDLKIKISGKMDNGTLVLDPALLPGNALAAWLTPPPTLSDVTVTLTGQTFTLTGTFGASLDIPHLPKVSLTGGVFTLTITQDQDNDTYTTSLSLTKGQLTLLDKKFNVSGSITDDEWQFDISTKNQGVELPSWTDLASLTGNSTVTTAVETLTSTFPGSAPTVTSLSITVDPKAEKLKNIDIKGEMNLYDGKVQYELTLPDAKLTANLIPNTATQGTTPGSVIHMKAVFQKYFPQSTLPVPNAEITVLNLSAAKSGDYSVQVTMTDILSIPVADSTLALNSVTLSINKTVTPADDSDNGSEPTSKTTGKIDGVITLGGVQFETIAAYDPDTEWTLTGQTLSDHIHLKPLVNDLLKVLGTSLPSAVPDIILTEVSFEINTKTKDFTFTARTSTEIEIPFLTGDHAKIHTSLELQNVTDTDTGHQQLLGFMEGDMVIGGSTFTLKYAVGQKTHEFDASWVANNAQDQLGFHTILGAMGIAHDFSGLNGIDLNLKAIYLKYITEQQTLQVVAQSANYGEAFMIVSKLPLGKSDTDDESSKSDDDASPSDTSTSSTDEGTWEFVFGWDYPTKHKLSDLPLPTALGDILAPADIFEMEAIAFIYSSANYTSFTLPALKDITIQSSDPNASPPSVSVSTPKLGNGSPIPLTQGLAFVTLFNLDANSSLGVMPAIQKVVNVADLTMMATVDPNTESFSLAAALIGGIKIPTGGKSDLKLSNAELSFIFNDGFTYQISGDMDLQFPHRTLAVKATLSFSEEAVDVSAEINFDGDTPATEGWHKPMGIPGLTLDEIAVEMGVNLIPAPGVNIGLEGKSHIGQQAPNSDDFAFVLEIIEEVPDPLLLSFFLAEIDIKTAMDVFVPNVNTSSIPDFVKGLQMTEVSFYWAESVVTMPDGTIAQPGLRLSGNIKILDFAAHASLSINQNTGLQGDFEMSPIHIGGILSVTGKGKGVHLKERNGVVLPVTAVPSGDTSGITTVEVVPPGGPQFAFRTTQSPYLQMSLDVSFLNFLSEEVEALVTTEGLLFKQEYKIGNLATAEIDYTLNETGFKATSYFGLHLQADLGPVEVAGIDFGTIPLDTGFDISMAVEATLPKENEKDKEGTFSMKVDGEFDFEGARLSFPTIELSVAPKSLEDLPEIIIAWMGEHLYEIFKDLLDVAGHLLEEAGKEVAKLAEAAGKEVAKLAEEAGEEAEKVVKAAGEAMEHAAEATKKAIDDVANEAKKVMDDAVDEVKKVGEETEHAVEAIGHEIANVVGEAEHEIAAIGADIAHDAEEVAQVVGELAEEAEQEVEQIGRAVAQEVAQVLAEARRVADAVIQVARQVVQALEQEAQALWNEAEQIADAIAQAIANAARAVWNAISKY